MRYQVVTDAGVDINGNHYEAGHEFFWDVLPEYISDLATAGDIVLQDAADTTALESFEAVNGVADAPVELPATPADAPVQEPAAPVTQ